MGILETVIVIAIIWAFAQVVVRRWVHSASGQGRPLADKLRDEAGRAVRGASHTWQGHHGRAWQVLALIIIVIVGFKLGGVRGEPSTLLYGIMFLTCGYLVFRIFVPSDSTTVRSSPIPPPLPPEAVAMGESEQLRPSARRRHPLLWMMWISSLTLVSLFVAVIVFRAVGAYAVLRAIGEAARTGQLDQALIHEIEMDEDFDPSELMARPPESHRVEEVPSPELPSTPKATEAAPPKAPIIPSSDLPAAKLHKSSTGIELATLTTEPYPSEIEARQAAMILAAQYLSHAIVQKGLVYTDWRPSLNWTSRNFVESLEIEKVERGDLSVFVGHADVRVPDEKKIEQIWNEFVKDKAAGRSLLLVKIFAGAVFMAGGIAVFLRLGTGRHVANEPVSLKKPWFGKKEPVNR